MNSFVGDEDTHIQYVHKASSSLYASTYFDFKWTVTKTIRFSMLVNFSD